MTRPVLQSCSHDYQPKFTGYRLSLYNILTIIRVHIESLRISMKSLLEFHLICHSVITGYVQKINKRQVIIPYKLSFRHLLKSLKVICTLVIAPTELGLATYGGHVFFPVCRLALVSQFNCCSTRGSRGQILNNNDFVCLLTMLS